VNHVTVASVTAKIAIAAITAPKNIMSPESMDILRICCGIQTGKRLSAVL
jgi:hypothetical protein